MEKDFDGWNSVKKEVNKKEFSDYIHEREVWWCSLGVNIGFEQDGKNKLFERPVLILRKFNKHTVLVIPLSSKVKNGPYDFPYIHEKREYVALLSQIRLISTKRLLRLSYWMDTTIFEIIKNEVKEMI